MSRGLNKVMIIGCVGHEPEMRYTPTGKPVVTFSVICPRFWTSQDGEKHSEKECFTIVAWGNLAEICNQFLKKGLQVYIEGRLQCHRWEDSEGCKHSAVEIIASEMMMLGDRKDNPALGIPGDTSFQESENSW